MAIFLSIDLVVSFDLFFNHELMGFDKKFVWVKLRINRVKISRVGSVLSPEMSLDLLCGFVFRNYQLSVWTNDVTFWIKINKSR